MTLILKVISYKGLPPAQVISAQFGEQGGSIGRAPDNHLVLPDAEKFVSRLHARIFFQGGQYIIADSSTGGTYLGLMNLMLQQNQAPLQNGEHLRIGEYELQAIISDNAPAAFAPIPEPVRQLELAEGGLLDELFATPKKTEQPTDFFSSFIEQPESSPIHENFTPPSVAATPTAKSADDLDFGDLLSSLDSLGGVPTPTSPQPEFPSLPDDFFAEELSGPAQPPVDVETPASPVSPIFPDASPFVEPPFFEVEDGNAAGRLVESNPFDTSHVVGDPFASEAFISAPSHSPVKTRPPIPKEPAAAPRASELQPKHLVADISDSELLRQFLAGAGISDVQFLRPEQLPTMLRTSGELLRSMVEGLMRVLRARAELKSQFRLSVTTMRSIDNNPLKFTPNVDDALKLILAPTNPGFLEPKESVREGFNDIMNHQIAMTAGIQAALAEILHSFDPEQIEKSQGEVGLFQKKAKYWEHYVEKYPQLKAAAQEDFFGDAFVEAYEKQMLLLSRSTKQ